MQRDETTRDPMPTSRLQKLRELRFPRNSFVTQGTHIIPYTFHICVFGLGGCGKSSFLNGLYRATHPTREATPPVADVGGGRTSVTKKRTFHQLLPNLVVSDCPGIVHPNRPVDTDIDFTQPLKEALEKSAEELEEELYIPNNRIQAFLLVASVETFLPSTSVETLRGRDEAKRTLVGLLEWMRNLPTIYLAPCNIVLTCKDKLNRTELQSVPQLLSEIALMLNVPVERIFLIENYHQGDGRGNTDDPRLNQAYLDIMINTCSSIKENYTKFCVPRATADFVIEQALYCQETDPSRYVSIKPQLEALVSNHHLHVNGGQGVYDRLYGENPFPGHRKVLSLIYHYKGLRYAATIPQDSSIELPVAIGAAPATPSRNIARTEEVQILPSPPPTDEGCVIS